MWLDEPVLVDIQKRAARVIVRLSSQWPTSAIELRTRDRVHAERMEPPRRSFRWNWQGFGNHALPEWIAAWRQIFCTISSPAPIANNGELRIGVKEPDAKAFTGGLDDLRFYGRAISPEEVERHGRQLSDSGFALRRRRQACQG